MFEPIVNRVAGLDIHKMVIVATILVTQKDGETRKETREFGTFRKHRRQLARWLNRFGIELVVMWKVREFSGRAFLKPLSKRP